MEMKGNRNSGVCGGRIAWLLAPVSAAVFLATSALAQLPPEMEIDRLLLRAERHAEDGEYVAMAALLDQVLALADEHGLRVPVDFWFRRAEMANRVGDYRTALESVTRYLQEAGREGTNYLDALELMTFAEEAMERDVAREEALQRVRTVFPDAGWVRIPPGEFVMGSTSEHSSHLESPVTRVRISREFWLGKYEVTQLQWEAVMGSNPSAFAGCARCPVELVSWNDVHEFLRRLNTAVGEDLYRLPTAAEWEYAARAGTKGDRYGQLDEIAWHSGNSEDRTHQVGQLAANAWGLHDMLGNVWEWVQDWHGEYPGGSVTDPVGPLSGSQRVFRGGSFSSDAEETRAPALGFAYPHVPYRARTGFRLLRTR